MNNLYAKFVKILEICKQFSENLVNEPGNVPRRGPVPKFSDLEVVALSLTAETESIDSEKWLFDYKLQEYKDSILNHSTNLRLTVQIHSTFSRVVHFYLDNHFIWLVKYDFKVRFNIIKYKYVKEFHFGIIFLAKKIVLSMIFRIFAATESATLPIWTANQGGSFAFMGTLRLYTKQGSPDKTGGLSI